MNTPYTFRHLEAPAEIAAAFDVMKELRPMLTDASAFATQVIAQHNEQYRLLAACDESGAVVGLAGYRWQTNLMHGRFVYVDDLVVTGRLQRSGLGAHLLDAVRQIARESDCGHLLLDTGMHMPLAQRFYFRNGMLAKGLRFIEPLTPAGIAASQIAGAR